jgi:hypothetical protein
MVWWHRVRYYLVRQHAAQISARAVLEGWSEHRFEAEITLAWMGRSTSAWHKAFYHALIRQKTHLKEQGIWT